MTAPAPPAAEPVDQVEGELELAGPAEHYRRVRHVDVHCEGGRVRLALLDDDVRAIGRFELDVDAMLSLLGRGAIATRGALGNPKRGRG